HHRFQRAAQAWGDDHGNRQGGSRLSALARRALRPPRQSATAIERGGLVMAEMVKPRPASTILLLRDAAAQNVDGKSRKEIEVCMMVRPYESDFNSGALVFPGGSVDKGDNDIIADPSLYSGGEGMAAGELSFRIAAIRETFEESGILLARPKGSKALVDAKR